MLNLIGAVAGLSIGLIASCASAATVQDVQGTVLVNRGSGFQSTSGNDSVAPGDRIMARQGGSAQIVYDNGCRVKVEEGRVVVVKPEPPCGAPVEADAGGVFGGGATPFVVGGIAIVGGGALAYGLSHAASNAASP